LWVAIFFLTPLWRIEAPKPNQSAHG